MAANRFGIDVASMYKDVEAIKGARTQNKLSALNLSEAERVIEERPAKEAAQKERQNMLTGLRTNAATGDADAQQKLLSIDPENAPAFIAAVSKMDDRKIAATKKSVEEIGKLSAYVLQGGTEQEQQRRYALMLGGVSEDVKSKLPVQYDPNFMQMSLSKATAMDKILENPKTINKGDTGEVWRGGQKIDSFSTGNAEKRAIDSAKNNSGSSGDGIKSADESLMYRQSAELLGGLFDQAGNITNLDPDVRNKVQGIATEATTIFKQGGVTRTQAVKLAAKKFGLNIQNPDAQEQDPQPTEIDYNDPEVIKNILLR